MKKTRILSLMASAVAAVALLIGCGTDFENGNDGLVSLELSSVSSSDMPTRAVIDGTAFPTAMGNIGLFLYADESASKPYGEGCANVRYSYNSTKEKWTASPSIKVGSTQGYLYGYYPYNIASTNVRAIPISSSVNGDDVMYAAKQTVTCATAPQTSITMNHALARVSITVKNNGYTGKAELSKIKFAGAETAPEGTLNALDGSVTATKSDVTLDVTGDAQTITTAGTIYECLLVPSKAVDGKQDVNLTLTIDCEDKTANLSDSNGVVIAQGTKSNITISLSNSGISVQTVSIDDWNVVEVGGHKVTIAVAEDVDPNDILTKAYVDGNNVIIKASSFQSKWLVCNVGDKAQCERAITNDKFTFTISEISSNIDAILDYAPPVTIKVLCDSNGNVWIGDDQSKTSGQFEVGQQVVIHVAPNDNFRLFKWDDNNRETSRTINVGEKDLTYSASFISSDLIPGLFTVNSSRKQVFFSRGNLFWNGSEYCFEDTQYTVYTKSGAEPENHIAHFYWSKSADVARSLSSYSDTGKPSDIFFANNPESFEVSGHTGWSVLTGNSDGEWKYLIERKDSEGNALYKSGVNVCGSADCLVLLPDDWKWGENGVGDDWQNGGYPETPTEGKVMWKTMEAAGAVCLTLAGYRGKDYLYIPADILSVYMEGLYWSSTPNGEYFAHCLDLNDDNVSLEINQGREDGCCVRLVTEVK